MKKLSLVLLSLLLVLSPISDAAMIVQMSKASSGGTGDMSKSTYDQNTNDIVDNAEALEGTDLGTLTDGKVCTYDATGTEIDCATTMTPDEVGTLTNTKWCTSDGSVVNCATDAPILTEVDPKISTLTSSKWCSTDGTVITCTEDAPAGSGDVTDVGNCTGGACLSGASGGGTSFALYDGDSNKGTFATANLDADRTYTFPNVTGTVALTTSNVSTASALAANGGNCSAGNAPLGVDASGAAEGCFSVVTSESDPKVGTLTNTKWCTTDGSTIACTTNAPVLTEVDPTVDTSAEVQAIIGAGVYEAALTKGNLTASTPLSFNNTRQVIGGATALSIADAAADGSTKGAATFTATHFDASSGVISIDFTNSKLTRSDQNEAITGNWDFGGALLLEVVNGSAPTLNADGQVAIDTTDGQFKYYSTSTRVISPVVTKDFTLESPADADAFLWFKAPYNMTITDIECIVDPADSSESVVIDVRECTGDGDSCSTVDATITCGNTTTSDDGTFSNATIDKDDYVLLDIGTVTGTVTQLNVRVKGTIDAT